MSNNHVDESEISKDLHIHAVKWCKQALSGTWKNIEERDINITELSGGLSSHLYICTLKPHKLSESVNGDPTTVLLRIYGDLAHSISGFIQHNALVSVTMAERDMGPQIYAFFPKARIEQFIRAKNLRLDQLYEPKVSAVIARKLAAFHAMDMPLPKEPKWLYKYLNNLITDTHACLITHEHYGQHKNDQIQRLLEYDFDDLFDSLREILSSVPSPVVFCHNDLQRGNILHRLDEADIDKSIMFIDFEYSHYNWRGMDWGNHFSEWCWDYSCDTTPFFKYFPERYPNYAEKVIFLRAYMLASGEQECHLTQEVLEGLCRESDTFALGANLLWAVWAIDMAFTSTIKFDYLEHAITRLDLYHRLKKMCFK